MVFSWRRRCGRALSAGIEQMTESLRRVRVRTVDLMQVHNLVDADTQLRTLAKWKAEGRVRYIGITYYQDGAYDAPADGSLLRGPVSRSDAIGVDRLFWRNQANRLSGFDAVALI
jgi:Aldo/keto reductase family